MQTTQGDEFSDYSKSCITLIWMKSICCGPIMKKSELKKSMLTFERHFWADRKRKWAREITDSSEVNRV
jgi:hypothetical protein